MSSVPRVRRETSQAYLSTALNLLGSSHETETHHPCLGPGLPEVLGTQAQLREGPMRCRCPSFAGTEWASGGGLGVARKSEQERHFL